MEWGSLGIGLLGGAAVGSILGGLGGGSSSGGGTSGTTTVQQSNDSATQSMLNALSTKAIDASNLPYVQYIGPRVADFTPDQLAAQQGVRNFADDPRFSQGITKGLETIGRGAETWVDADRAAYMNPYVEDVLNRITTRLDDQRRMKMNEIGAAAAKAGAFGGTRQGVVEARTNQGFFDTMADTTAKGLSTAYDTGLKAWQADRDAQLKAGQGMIEGVNLGQTADLSRLSALESIGSADQQLQQRGLDVGYQNFAEARDWPRQQVELLAGAARSAPSAKSTVQTQGTTTQTPLLSQIAGLATTGLAAYKLFS